MLALPYQRLDRALVLFVARRRDVGLARAQILQVPAQLPDLLRLGTVRGFELPDAAIEGVDARPELVQRPEDPVAQLVDLHPQLAVAADRPGRRLGQRP